MVGGNQGHFLNVRKKERKEEGGGATPLKLIGRKREAAARRAGPKKNLGGGGVFLNLKKEDEGLGNGTQKVGPENEELKER